MGNHKKILIPEKKAHIELLNVIGDILRRLHTAQVHNRDKLEIRHIKYFKNDGYQIYPIVLFEDIIKDNSIERIASTFNEILIKYKYDKRKTIWHLLDKLLIGKDKFWRFDDDNNPSVIQIIDAMAMPESFVYSYFGFDTGIDGLNLLFKGGMMLPVDRTSYIAVNGESGAGKTNFTLKLTTAICLNKGTGFDIHYFLIEQSYQNLERIIKHFNMLPNLDESSHFEEDNNDGSYILRSIKFENKKNFDIHIHPVDMYSSGQLMQKISEQIKKNPTKTSKKPVETKKNENPRRQIFVIDSVNALMDSNMGSDSWRQELQAIKAITKSNKAIVVFVQEKTDLGVSNSVDYTSDIVIQLHEEISITNKCRSLEVVKSRFQDVHFGKHPLFYNDNSKAPILVYPQTDTMHHIMRSKSIPIEFKEEVKEFGVKIDGVENIYYYMHRSSHDEKPVIVKNSLTLLSGERGCFKTKFAELFARSAFRDEHHFRAVYWDNKKFFILHPLPMHKNDQVPFIVFTATSTKLNLYILSVDKSNNVCKHTNEKYSELGSELENLLYVALNAYKLGFSIFDKENNPITQFLEKLITSNSKITFRLTEIIKNDKNNLLEGSLTVDIINADSSKNSNKFKLSKEDKTSITAASDINSTDIVILPDSLVELDFRLRPVVKSDSEFNYFKKNQADYVQDKAVSILISFGETYTFGPKDRALETFFGRLIFICSDTEDINAKAEIPFVKVSMIVIYFEVKNYTEDIYFQEIMSIVRALKQYRISDPIPSSYDVYINKARFSLDNRENKEDKEDKEMNTMNKNEYNPYAAVDLSSDASKSKSTAGFIYLDNSFSIQVTRMVIDNCANMDSIFKTIDYRKFLTSISHYCLSNNISTFLVNTINHGETNEISQVCNSLADNVIRFRKVSLKGTWLSTFRILRSTNNRHSGMIRQIIQKKDNSLALKDSFSFNSNFDEPGENQLDIKLIMPGSTHGLIKYLNKFNSSIKLSTTQNSLWHDRLEEQIKASLCYDQVKVETLHHEFTDSIVLFKDNTYKDCCTILCLPGHLLSKYDHHLVPVSDYIQFYPKKNPEWFYEEQHSGKEWEKDKLFKKFVAEEDPLFLGKINPTLHESPVSILSEDDKKRNQNGTTIENGEFIIPYSTFLPSLVKESAKNNKEKYKTDNWHIDGESYHSCQINAMPYYIDPRLDLYLSSTHNKKKVVLGCISHETLTVYCLEEILKDINFGKIDLKKSIQEIIAKPVECFTRIPKIIEDTFIFHDELNPNVQPSEFRVFIKSKIGQCSETNNQLHANLKKYKIRDYFSNHKELINTLNEISKSETVPSYVLDVPDISIYNSWYLGVPADTPRQGTACEIITSMTKLNELAALQNYGVGMSFCENMYDSDNTSLNPSLNSNALLKRMLSFEKYLEKGKHVLPENFAFPLSHLSCFHKLVAPIGGILMDAYNAFEAGISVESNSLATKVLKVLKTTCSSTECGKGDKCLFYCKD